MFPARSNSGIRSMNSDSSIIEMNERTANRTPTRRQPMANSGRLIKKLSRPTFSPVTLESTVAIPVTPPGAMSLGSKERRERERGQQRAQRQQQIIPDQLTAFRLKSIFSIFSSRCLSMPLWALCLRQRLILQYSLSHGCAVPDLRRSACLPPAPRAKAPRPRRGSSFIRPFSV